MCDDSELDVLDACPFCGSGQDNAGEYPFPNDRLGTEWIARCGDPDCGAEIRADTRADVIVRWNRRVKMKS